MLFLPFAALLGCQPFTALPADEAVETIDDDPVFAGDDDDDDDDDVTSGTTATPLRVHEGNPRYFDDGTGRAVLLVGANNGWELQDHGWSTEYTLDYPAYLDYLESYNLNFIRLWRVESALQSEDDTRLATPMPYRRMGPNFAHDGQLRYDLDQFDPAFFDRLRDRVEQAADRGIYVDLMLFERHSTFNHNGPLFPWRAHPFQRDNNVNGVDSDGNADGEGREYFLMPEQGGSASALAYQEAYIRKVLETVNGLDNVIVEICNECKPEASDWQAHMIAYTRQTMAELGTQYPIGFTGPGTYDNGSFPDFQVQLDSTADFVSPRDNAAYRNNPPANDGAKVIFADSDHIDPFGRDEVWVWKSFLRGLHPQALEAYQGVTEGPGVDPVRDEYVRQNMGYCLVFAQDFNLALATPHGELSSSGYALAQPGEEYVVWVPDGDPVDVDLTAVTGDIEPTWLDIYTGELRPEARVDGGQMSTFYSPFADHSVLLLVR